MAHVLAKDLRDAVLQAAFEGKLTYQNERDNSIELFRSLSETKKTLIDNGIIKKQKKIKFKFDSSILFDIPKNWIWVTLDDVITILGDGLHGTPEYDDHGEYYFINGNNFTNEKIRIKTDTKRVNETQYQKYKKVLNDRTIFISINGTLGKIAVYNNEKIILGKSACYFNLLDNLNKNYVLLFLKSLFFLNYISDNATGATIKNVSLDVMRSTMIPLPPIEEQARIVAKVDELMAKIDEYEKLENKLAHLKKDFPGDMKTAVLQAAMEGKLTERLATDSNAFNLSEKIKKERKVLGKNKYVTDNLDYFNIPEAWALIKSGECFSLEKGKQVSGVNLPYLEAKYIRGKKTATMKTSGQFVSKDTEVILVDGENSGEIFIEPEDGIIGSTFKVLFIPKSINKKYALYFLNMNRDLFRNNKKGSAIPHLNKEIFNNLDMPIPPIEEQQRIVEKLDKLLPLCDALVE